MFRIHLFKSHSLVLWLFLSISSLGLAQQKTVSISGVLLDKKANLPLAYVNVILIKASDSSFVAGTISTDAGRFTLSELKPGKYVINCSFIGYKTNKQAVFIGDLSPFLDLGILELENDAQRLNEVVISGQQDLVNSKMDKKTFSLSDVVTQQGGSLLQVMQNLPGVSVQDGKVQLRGNDKVMVLIDGKQTALTGFGNQSGLANIPASAIEKIEILNNPSAKFDANGNGGILNIIYKKEQKEGYNAKLGLSTGLGALWVKKENLPGVTRQYQATPKINPSLSVNHRGKKTNVFLQADNLYTHTLNKNEFVERKYADGSAISQQTKRNRNTNLFSGKTGLDWQLNTLNTLNFSGFFSSEKILDQGEQPFFATNKERVRLWQFLEDELKTTAMASVAFEHAFAQPGKKLNVGLNYTYHRENEKYFFTNTLANSVGYDAFKLLSDEQVLDFNFDYTKPLRYGRFETGVKFRRRSIPTNMQFYPGLNSPLDSSAGGAANYAELIPAVYGNYLVATQNMEAELGLRLEYVGVNYAVGANHPSYSSSAYNYTQPFPSVRLTRKLNRGNNLSLFYNRRVDRPNEVDIRIFPKYDDAEIIKVGNPALRPQFTNAVELAYKKSWDDAYVFLAVFQRNSTATITRIASSLPNSQLIYAVFQNAGKSQQRGVEFILNKKLLKKHNAQLSATVYDSRIDAFTVLNKYPSATIFSADAQQAISGNVKANVSFHLKNNIDAQLTCTYWAPDLIPQGRIASRFGVDIGLKKQVQGGKGSFFLNASDLLNTMRTKKFIQGSNFSYSSIDYFETQLIRLGYNYSF